MTKITILVLILFIITACKSNKNNMPQMEIDIYKGTDGLVINYLPGVPPANVLEEGVLPIGISLDNKGAFDINEGYLSFILEKDYMKLKDDLDVLGIRIGAATDNRAVFSLKGKSIYQPIGESGAVTISADIKKIEAQSEKHTSDVIVAACYHYNTKLVETICIDDDIFNTRPSKKVCTVADIGLASQGAPIAITKIETKILPEGEELVKPQFILYIENKGTGEVISKDKLGDFCSASSSLNREDWNTLSISGVLSDSALSCKADPVKIRDKQGMAICTLEGGIERRGAYKTPLEITLDYGYMSTISKKVTIEKLGTQSRN